MTSFAFPAAPPITLATTDGRSLPVRRVFCVGRNYADHAREMGSDPSREPPFFFTKPADALTQAATLPYPPATERLDHEVELVAVLGAGGVDLTPNQGLDCVWGYTVGIDLTRRDLQEIAKKTARPWDMAKGFDLSGPCGLVRPAAEIGHPASGAITLDIGGERRQTGDLAQMIWSTGEVIAHLSRLVRLCPGDVVFTGTPAGVGPIPRGAAISAHIDGVADLELVIG